MLRVSLAVFVAMFDAIPAAYCGEPADEPSHIVSRIPRQPVQSTAIAKIGYSKRRHILEIEFVNGAVYRYLEVPAAAYRNLISAESKARFYDFNIKGHYESVPIRLPQKVPTKSHE
jgi:hypothetical protein